MLTWIISGTVAVLALVVVIVAIVRDPVGGRRASPPPDWDLPRPEQVSGVTFPISLQGYDPDAVEAFTAAVADVLAVLTEEAGPDAVARARARLRRGRPNADRHEAAGAGGPTSGEELEDGGGDRAGILEG